MADIAAEKAERMSSDATKTAFCTVGLAFEKTGDHSGKE
jgi:hypothetical protein